MSSFKMLALAVATLAVVACGKTSGDKAAAKANHEIDQMNQIAQTLRTTKGIDISTQANADEKRAVPQSHSPSDLATIQAMLETYVQLGQDVTRLMRNSDSPTLPIVKNGVKDAQNWLVKVQARMTELRTGVKTPKEKEVAPKDPKKLSRNAKLA